MSKTLHLYPVWTLWFVTQITLQEWCWMALSAITRPHATPTWFSGDGCSGENQLPCKKFSPRNYHTGAMSWGHSGQHQLWPREWDVWTFSTAEISDDYSPRWWLTCHHRRDLRPELSGQFLPEVLSRISWGHPNACHKWLVLE